MPFNRATLRGSHVPLSNEAQGPPSDDDEQSAVPSPGSGEEDEQEEQQLHQHQPGERPEWWHLDHRHRILGMPMVLLLLFGLVFMVIQVKVGRGNERHTAPAPAEEQQQHQQQTLVTRIAFGSCTAKGVEDEGSQPIWQGGVIPADPDVWIWLGDFIYGDYPDVNCEGAPNATECNCIQEDVFYKTEPWCLAGDVEHVMGKYRTMLNHPDYNAFLDFMCPKEKRKGHFPPRGMDLSMCPKRIMGIYDDHEWYNDGDHRLPSKWVFIKLFLDAMGEDPQSPRRNMHRGAWHKYTLNEEFPGREIDVFLLDERYNRDVRPCYTRAKWCEDLVLAIPGHSHTSYCTDFLHGGVDGRGNCCTKDEEIQFGWCLEEANKLNSPLWEEACDYTSPIFGRRSLFLDSETGELRPPDGSELQDTFEGSPFCEVLGRQQRQWLREELAASPAALRLIASPSVLVGQPGLHDLNGVNSSCGGDDFDCYRSAQRNLLYTIGSSSGCNIILTGDYHWGDIKMLDKGFHPTYTDWFGTHHLKHPLYQVMSSGLTRSTAVGYDCDGFRLDPAGLRLNSECEFVAVPNFGVIDVTYVDDWSPDKEYGGIEKIELTVRDETNTVHLKQTLIPAQVCNQ